MHFQGDYSKRNSITANLLAAILLVVISTGLIVVVAALVTNFQSERNALNLRMQQLQDSLVPELVSSLWTFDQEQLQQTVERAANTEDVYQVQVNWEDWNTEPKTLAVANSAFTDAPSRTITLRRPLVFRDEATPAWQLGELILTVSMDSVYAQLGSQAKLVLLLQVAQAITITGLLFWLIRYLLVRHMNTIAQHARSVTLANLQAPLELSRPRNRLGREDELDNIVEAFNHMRERLQAELDAQRDIQAKLLLEQRQNERSERAKLAAEAANRAKSQFLATMSHEIRTPMNGIIGLVELLHESPLSANQKHYLATIRQSGLSLLDIINDVLDYSKIETGKLELENIEFDLEQLLEDCLQMFAASAEQKNIELHASIHLRTPARLVGDPTRIRQLLVNLVGNAVKFTETGHVTVKVTREALVEPGIADLVFTVKDTGIGIPTNQMPYLFESFRQGDSSTTRRFGGSGLGLAICKRLVELMGGSIEVKSQLGAGSQFQFNVRLPSAKAVREPVGQPLSLAEKRILVVSQSQYMTELLKAQSELGHCIITTVTPTDQVSAKSPIIGADADFVVIDGWSDDSHQPLGLSAALGAEEIPTGVHVIALAGEQTSARPNTLPRRVTWLAKPIVGNKLASRLAQTMVKLSEPNPCPSIHSFSAPGLGELSVLVAEDNGVNLMVIKGLLARLGINPVITRNGREALNAATGAQRPYDLILMDCEMPELDGYEATRAIRQHEREHKLNATPIVALTAHALDEHRDIAFSSGMNYFLRKPMTFSSLITMAEALRLTGASETGLRNKNESADDNLSSLV